MVRRTAKRSTKTSLSSSQKRLKERQSPPWERIKELGIEDPEIYTLPWGFNPSAFGLKNLSGIGAVGKSNNTPIMYFASKPYSWEKYIINKSTGNTLTPHKNGEDSDRFVLRKDQQEDVEMIVKAYKTGAPEFLIANKTGTGKTVTTWKSILEMKPRSVLIVCPQAVIPVWRKHITEMGDAGIQIVVINYESLKRLISPPDKAVSAKKTATQNKHIALHGEIYNAFDMVIVDESHKISNPTSQQTRITQKFCDKAKFSLKLTATPGKDPSQLHYLWRGLSYATGDDISVRDENDFKKYIKWCARNGINGIVNAPFGNGITFNGGQSDLETMSDILYGKTQSGINWATKRRGDTGTTPRESLPVELSEEQMSDYELVVQDATDSVLNIKNKGRQDLTKGLAAMMSLRQKSGVLKAKSIVDYAKYCVDDLGEQVVITSYFHNTTDVLSQLLEEAKIDYVIIDGEMTTQEKEDARLEFQHGNVPVVITSVTTGISLHANEDKETTDNPRRMIVADMQWSPREHEQLEGRINRNGEIGVVTIPYLENTIDKKLATAILSGMASQSIIQDDTDSANTIEFFASVMGIDLGL